MGRGPGPQVPAWVLALACAQVGLAVWMVATMPPAAPGPAAAAAGAAGGAY